MKDILTSPRIVAMRRKRKVERVRFYILVFILLVSIVVGLSYLSSYSRLIINNVTITGTRTIDNGAVQDTVKETMVGKYLKLFAKANTIIYPKRQIYRNLIAKFPRIETLSVYRDNWHTIHIYITERSGSSLYCGAKIPDLETDVGENCYFINNDGYIFGKAPYFSGNIYFKYYVPLDSTEVQSSTSSPLGEQMLTPNRFHSLENFVTKIESFGFKPNYLVIEPGGDDTIYLDHNTGDTSPTILFKDVDDFNVISDNLSTAMSKPEFANEINSKYTSLLYIDLRFQNKVIYKFK